MTSDRNASAGTTFSAVLTLPFGGLGLRSDQSCIRELVFLPPGTLARAPDSPLAERAAMQLLAWLDDPDRPFDLPLAERGTPFQRRVWDEIRRIPYGETISYAELARRAGAPGAARAAGAATGRNPLSIVVPCHRVIASGGSLTGYAGGIARKTRLLEIEGALRAEAA